MLRNKRLQTLLDLTDHNLNVADIGADHGKLSIELAKISNQVYATEYHSQPYLNLLQNINKSGSSNINVLQGDGFLPLANHDIDIAIVAGLGGGVISEMIVKSNNIKTLILCPQNNIEKLRTTLKTYNYKIIEEIILKEKGLYYNIIKTLKSQNTNIVSRKDILIGPLFKKNTITKEFLNIKINQLTKINKHRNDKNIKKDIMEIRKILKSW